MPLSQCWCVDNESNLVLRVRGSSYYRIELPFETQEDKAKAEELKVAIAKVLRYEKTPCPFQRGFHVDLPEVQESPSRIRIGQSDISKTQLSKLKGIWEPENKIVRRSSAPIRQERRDSASEASTDAATDDSSVAEESEDDSAPRQPVQPTTEQSLESVDPTAIEDKRVSPETVEEDKEPSKIITDSDPVESELSQSIQTTAPTPDSDQPPALENSALCSTEPQQAPTPEHTTDVQSTKDPEPPQEVLPLHSTTEPSPLEENTDLLHVEDDQVETDTLSLVSSHASFHTASDDESTLSIDDDLESMTETNLRHNGSPILRRPHHTREVSEITITARNDSPTNAGEGSTRSLSPPLTPTLIADIDEVDDHEWHDAVTPPDTLRMRRPAKSQSRARSPGTRALHSPNASRTGMVTYSPGLFSSSSIPGKGKQLTAALIQKAYSLLVGPPADLVALMLRIAAKIANGASIFTSYDLGREMEGVTLSAANTSSSSKPNNIDDPDDWDEDDFGVPLGNTVSNASRSSSLNRDRVISRGRQRTPHEIWGELD